MTHIKPCTVSLALARSKLTNFCEACSLRFSLVANWMKWPGQMRTRKHIPTVFTHVTLWRKATLQTIQMEACAQVDPNRWIQCSTSDTRIMQRHIIRPSQPNKDRFKVTLSLKWLFESFFRSLKVFGFLIRAPDSIASEYWSKVNTYVLPDSRKAPGSSVDQESFFVAQLQNGSPNWDIFGNPKTDKFMEHLHLSYTPSPKESIKSYSVVFLFMISNFESEHEMWNSVILAFSC